MEKFPFIEHQGDKKTPRPGGEENEEIKIKSVDSLSDLYVCIVNYSAAIENRSITFNEHSGRIEITTDTQDNLEVLADSTDSGHVYLVCRIVNDAGNKKAINVVTTFALSNHSSTTQ